MIWFFLTRWPFFTMGFWFKHVRSLSPTNFRSSYSSRPSLVVTTMRVASTYSTSPALCASTTSPVSSAARRSMPVPTTGASVLSSGTAWRCMFEPISARLASSCSRNGISAAETETVCRGLMSMY